MHHYCDSLVVWQGCHIERLSGPWTQGYRVCLLLGYESSSVGLVNIQTDGGGETVRHHKWQVLKALQLTRLLMADLQTHSVVPLFQLQGILKKTGKGKGKTFPVNKCTPAI